MKNKVYVSLLFLSACLTSAASFAAQSIPLHCSVDFEKKTQEYNFQLEPNIDYSLAPELTDAFAPRLACTDSQCNGIVLFDVYNNLNRAYWTNTNSIRFHENDFGFKHEIMISCNKI